MTRTPAEVHVFDADKTYIQTLGEHELAFERLKTETLKFKS